MQLDESASVIAKNSINPQPLDYANTNHQTLTQTRIKIQLDESASVIAPSSTRTKPLVYAHTEKKIRPEPETKPEH